MPDDRTKRPAYQWYVNDARGDEVFMLMSYEQQGIYRALLDHQWIEGSLPADVTQIAGLVPKISRTRFGNLWPLISAKFQTRNDGRLVNARLELQKKNLDEFIEEQRKRGQKGGRRKADLLAVARAGLEPDATSSSSTSSSTSKHKNTEKSVSSATSAEPSSPSVLEFPTVGPQGQIWCLTEAQVGEWQALFPSTDILAEARKALAWVRADLGRRKTANGMPRFLVGWLTRTVNGHRGGVSSVVGKPAAPFIGRRQQVPDDEPL